MSIVVHRYLKKCKTNIYPPGLADFLRGSLTLISLAEYFDYSFYFDASSHPFFKCLKPSNYFAKIENSLETLEIIPPIDEESIKNNLLKLFYSKNNFILITNKDAITPINENHINIIREILTPSETLQNKIDQFLKNSINTNYPYIVCHFRLGDNFMGKGNHIDQTQFEYLKQYILIIIEENSDIPKENIIVISDCYDFKIRLKEYNITISDFFPIHMGIDSDSEMDHIENTMIEFFVMSKAKHIYTFSNYSSSGFSSIINKIFTVPLLNTQFSITK